MEKSIKNYLDVMKKYFPKMKTSEAMAKKVFQSKQKTKIGKSVLVEYHKAPECYVVTDLITEKKYVYAPRFDNKKNEELNLISGITSLGLFDSDNVYCGQLDPNNTGIREPMVISAPDETTKIVAPINAFLSKSTDILPGAKYDTIFGVFEVLSVEDGTVYVKDRNAVEMEVSEEDFMKLNPIVSGNEQTAEEEDSIAEAVQNKYRIIFKTLQNDGSLREWCMVSNTEEEMDAQLEEIKQRQDLVEITNILPPDDLGDEVKGNEQEPSEEEEFAEEPENVNVNVEVEEGGEKAPFGREQQEEIATETEETEQIEEVEKEPEEEKPHVVGARIA